MKITAFNGSPRGSNGNTQVMVEAFLNGAQASGAEVENIFLAKKDIKHCLGCFQCWTKTPGQCVIKDDMPELRAKFMSADIIVFATPLYVDNVTGIMKDIPRGGAILSEPPLILLPLIWKYKRLLKQAGREVVGKLRLSEETILQLNEPIISDDQYIKGANKNWDKLLAKTPIAPETTE